MGILSKILTGGASDLINAIGDAVDKNTTTDAERITLKNEIQKVVLEYEDKDAERKANLDKAADEQATQRLVSDNTSDNKWSKNIRPVSFAWSLGIFSLFTFLAGTQKMNTPEMYITVWQYILLTQIAFYFSSRGLEKISDIISKIWKK